MCVLGHFWMHAPPSKICTYNPPQEPELTETIERAKFKIFWPKLGRKCIFFGVLLRYSNEEALKVHVPFLENLGKNISEEK